MSDLGRRRRFDREVALDRAMHLFWIHGYEATSLSALTATMGINPPSLYAAFGSKEGLFRDAVARYVAAETEATRAVLEAPGTARAAIEALLRRAARRIARDGAPKGCLVMLGAIHCAPENRQIGDFLAGHRQAAEQILRERIERGIAEGDVDSGADAEGLATFYASILSGLSLSARDGIRQPELEKIVTRAMSGWEVCSEAA